MSDPLVKEEIGRDNPGKKIVIFDEIDSTNTEAKRMLEKADLREVQNLHDTVLIADHQTQGRGRLGRNFYSPHESGLYLSLILLRDKGDYVVPTMMTPAAAVAVCRTLEKLSGTECRIKWVNDIFAGGKKVCGILTEGVLTPSSEGTAQTFNGVVIGIGINVRGAEDAFPQDIQHIAGSLESAGLKGNDSEKGGPVLSRNAIASELLRQLDIALREENRMETVEEYRAKSLVIGRRINVIQGDSSYPAEAVSLTDDCHLLVKPEGSEQLVELQSGEVSVRFAD
ncbi:MAG: biotin--[acetyl-CoA-carboxylase] ligase [Treponemataceae bacterium]|nr:biotin--[acetyl-CoA-carboxylase] ligase [Treponemataceae bacterium]